MLANSSGTVAYKDDVIVMGSNVPELNTRLCSVLKQMTAYGFRVQAQKCTFFVDCIKYLGFIIDKNGRCPDPESIKAIQDMSAPHDKATLLSFLGLISNYSAFIPEMHRLRGPLNCLLSKNVPWNWSAECQRAFDGVKKALTSKIGLTHYNPQLPIVVAADASQYGIGAVVSHRFPDGSEKPIMHAARSLTASEHN